MVGFRYNNYNLLISVLSGLIFRYLRDGWKCRHNASFPHRVGADSHHLLALIDQYWCIDTSVCSGETSVRTFFLLTSAKCFASAQTLKSKWKELVNERISVCSVCGYRAEMGKCRSEGLLKCRRHTLHVYILVRMKKKPKWMRNSW